MSTYYSNDYTNDRNGQYYGAPQQNYNTYQPPRDDGYRHDMAVARYDDDRTQYTDARSNSRRGSVRDRYDDDRYYEERRSEYEDRDRRRSSSSRQSRPQSRGLFDGEGERGHKDHHKGKDVGATVLGGAVGAFAGHELGHNGLATTIGALAGAWGGHELEKHHEKKKERRESQQYDSNSRRSFDEEVEYSDDDSDDRRRHHHHHRDSDRYD